MAFDPSTAEPEHTGFDPGTAQPAPAEKSLGEKLVHAVIHPIDAWKERIASIAADQRKANAEIEASLARGDRFPKSPTTEAMANETAMGFVAPSGGNSLARFAQSSVPKASAAAQTAIAQGYRIPPPSAADNPGLVNNALSSLGGEVKTAQLASVKNQVVTNKLAAKALGLPEDTQLTDQTFRMVRDQASQAYKAVANSVPEIKPDVQFKTEVAKLGGRSGAAAQAFPNLMKNDAIKEIVDELGSAGNFSPQAGIDLVRELRAAATAHLKAIGDPAKHALGHAQKQAADAIDSLIERNLTAAGKPEAVQAYRDARQLIAKSHDVEAATNTANGNVAAHDLARMAGKGRPLSGELKTIAETAEAFPKATQSPEKFGGNKRWSAVDAIAALAATSGHPGLLAGIVARPVARELALSKLVQNQLARARPNMSAASPANSLARIMLPSQSIQAPERPTFSPAIP